MQLKNSSARAAMRGQSSVEWLLALVCIIFCIALLSFPSHQIAALISSSTQLQSSAIELSDAALLAHSSMFGDFSAIVPEGNFTTHGRCLFLPGGSACQAMARNLYIDRGAIKYGEIGEAEPI